MDTIHLLPSVAIRPNLELKTQPKQLLGSLPLVIALPALAYLAVATKKKRLIELKPDFRSRLRNFYCSTPFPVFPSFPFDNRWRPLLSPTKQSPTRDRRRKRRRSRFSSFSTLFPAAARPSCGRRTGGGGARRSRWPR